MEEKYGVERSDEHEAIRSLIGEGPTLPSGCTALLGIIAHPVQHIRAATEMNRLFHGRRIDAVMVPLDVEPKYLTEAVNGLRRMQNLRGFCVTVPHKQAILPLLDSLSDRARQTGSVNAVRRTEGGILHGDQFDGPGFVAGILGAGHEIRGRSVFLIGAGGSAAAIAFSLAEEGAAIITIRNRSASRGRQLVNEVAAAYPNVSVRAAIGELSDQDIVINATTLGMKANDPSPIDFLALRKEMLICEVVMSPRETPLVLAAQREGCPIVYGTAMMVSQLAMLASFWELDGLERSSQV